MKNTDLPLHSKQRVKVEGIGTLGEGLARIDGAEIFIPKVAPQDELEIEIIENKKNRFRAKTLQILKSSPLRVPAACKHFEICGGCDFQHLPYQEQIDWKLRMTKHWIRRSSLAPLLDKIPFDQIESPEEYGYRHRARLQVKNGRVHFFKPHSHEIFEIEECPIFQNGFLKALQEKALTLADQKDWNQSFSNGKLIEGEAFYELDDCKIFYNEKCFTQTNFDVNEQIWFRILEDIENLEQKKTALDLYCGIGNFSLPLSNYFEKVTGIEAEGESIAFARKNSEAQKKNIRWISGLCEEKLLELESKYEFFDFVLLDPPRTGALKSVQVLSRLMPTKIVYVSCHLESLIHDLIFLNKKGGYQIKRWTVADMFPQTHHIESIVTLSRT
ncbi:MAG: class I SAM-dependent RNA methyltransferase [Deltaproteobacteria bacterium]|nr:class I SAM-dependent RNA methyltransferase [Deltaproteobacteria bacterium]